MAESKKYYWLKLKRDFFKRHDIRIIEEMPNGKDYILFYLKLLLESVDHEGNLRFSDTIPYNEQMLSVVTNTNVDIVRSAMRLFVELNMMEILDDKTIYMSEVDRYIGSETQWAEKKRIQRAKWDNVPRLSSNCPTELELKSLEEDIYTTTTTDAPTLTEVYLYFKSCCETDAIGETDKFHAYNAKRGWDCLPGWKEAADLWIARIKEHER